MKRSFAVLFLIAVILTACTTPSIDTSSALKGAGTVSGSPVDNSKETSSEGKDVFVIKEIDGIEYYDAKAAGADKQVVFVDPFTNKVTGDHSAFFPEDAEGYYIDDMLFYVDEETFYRILSKPCKGTGSIKWKGYNEEISWHGDEIGLDGKRYGNDGFHGILPVDKFDDPFYVFMCKPSERVNYMGQSRINAGNMSPPEDRFVSALTMGAIYRNVEKELPDDAEFTICIGRMTLIYYTDERGWYIEKEWETPSKPNSIYYLPWTLEWNGAPPAKLPDDRVTLVDGHYEIKLTGEMLNGNYGKGKEAGAEGAVLHFWSPKIPLENGSSIRAVAASYECWIKETEWAEYVTAEIGADWRDGDKVGQEIYQAFAGHNYAISTEPRVIFGHTCGPDMYDEVMDTELLKQLLRLK